MPELPEVETLRKGLLRKTKGRTISKVDIIKYKKADRKIKKLSLAKIKNVRRRAKLLVIDLSNGYSMVVHVKLTGYFYFQPKGKKMIDKVTRVVFWFKDGSALLFEDVRKFGWIKIMKTKDVEKYLVKCKFGPEPLSKEFSLKKFKEMLKKRRKSKIKPLLMDQCFVAGIGNIYAQEACYCAGILPMRKVESLSDKETKKLYKCIIKILKLAIRHKGTSAVDYVTVEGKKGTFASKLKVYQRKKDPRGHKLIRIVLGGRGTNYCKVCQK
ncbi:MAG: DNA-formamidopyrimidine glycosylase [Nanoarchaeota archaeon]|nr:DNA-formamidopyrimidine glycosylase [Nanoarchaeota archaeon]